MEAPDKIYVEIRHPISTEYTEIIGFDTPEENTIKYIRADIAELTWEDIPRLIELTGKTFRTFVDEGRSDVSLQELYEAVLKAFNDKK